jgi:hypothetical protein
MLHNLIQLLGIRLALIQGTQPAYNAIYAISIISQIGAIVTPEAMLVQYFLMC